MVTINYATNKKEVFSFRRIVSGGESGYLDARIKSPGTVEEVRARFYQGQQRSLKVRPIVLHKGNKTENLLTFADGTDPYLSGDNDYLTFPIVVTVDYDDTLRVYYDNTDNANDYTLSIDVIVDYYGGTDRVL